jgi:hypothetical protein
MQREKTGNVMRLVLDLRNFMAGNGGGLKREVENLRSEL